VELVAEQVDNLVEEINEGGEKQSVERSFSPEQGSPRPDLPVHEEETPLVGG